MPRFQHVQRKLQGVFLCKSGETLVTVLFERPNSAERARLIAPAPGGAVPVS